MKGRGTSIPSSGRLRLIAAAEQAVGITISLTDSGRAYCYDDVTHRYFWLAVKDLRCAVRLAQNPDTYNSRWYVVSSHPLSARATRAMTFVC